MNRVLFQLSDKLYVRDPLKTETGKAIISNSVHLIGDLGFDNVTFRKIAEQMKSTEATIYRYFENKFRLLQYLADWYWTAMNFEIEFHLNNVTDAEEKLKICLQLLAGARKPVNVSPIDHQMLHRIVIAEFDKTYLYRSIDRDYKNGLLGPFNDTCKTIADIVREINPKYAFPHSLVSTAISAAIQQIYFSRHMPLLSDIKNDQKIMNDRLYRFLEGFVLTTVKAE
jgi:AcrR family transcriptional regulator